MMVTMNRRELFKLTAAAAAVPSLAPAQHVHGIQSAPAADPAWKPSALDEHQNQTLIELSDLIIPATDTPGAKDALVNRYIDKFLAAGPQKELERMLDGLASLDGYAIRTHGRPFTGCTKEQRIAILTALDAGKEPGIEPAHQFFQQIKSWVARVYYNTKAGYDELNKGGRIPSTLGCQHPGHHASNG